MRSLPCVLTLSPGVIVRCEAPDLTGAPDIGTPVARQDGGWAHIASVLARADVPGQELWWVREDLRHELIRVRDLGAVCEEVRL